PCSPFSVSRDLMRESAALARDKGVRLHTHLAENAEDVAYSQEQFGCRPGTYAEDLGWVGEDVWHAHCVALDDNEISLFGRTGTGVAHCPCSNGRLGSGIAPVVKMRAKGVPVGLGVDGSASNDSGHLLCEARQALLVARLAGGADAMSARTALEIATRGSAQVLGRLNELGSLEPGKRADLAIWAMDGLASAGSWDPVAALVLTGPHQARDVMVEGRWIVSNGQLTTVDVRALAAKARSAVGCLAEG
ncbi:MAG: amidohydrolase family protein, partial [Pseudomonadota bacterium]